MAALRESRPTDSVELTTVVLASRYIMRIISVLGAVLITGCATQGTSSYASPYTTLYPTEQEAESACPESAWVGASYGEGFKLDGYKCRRAVSSGK